MLAKITKRTVEGLAPKAWLWDTEFKGFGARRQTDGIFYYLRYRLNGLQRTKSLGRHGHLTPELARAQAKQRLGKIASGIDPFAEEATARAAETFGGELERYLEQQQGKLKPRSFEEIKRHLAVYAGPLHRMRLGEINRRAIAVQLAEVEKESGIVSRNRLRSSLSAFFTWIIQEGFIEANPVIGTRKIDEGGSRERVLTQTELAQLWTTLGQSNSTPLGQFGDIVRLLILTGQRRNEIAALRWDEVDFDRAVITLPPARTKNNRTHELPLSPLALAILQRQPRRKGQEFVFPNRNGGPFDPEKARTFTIFHWMYRGDFRPLAWSIDQGHDLPPAVLNLLHDLIVEDRLKLKPRKGGSPKKPGKLARDIIAALAYEAHSGKTDEAFAAIADAIGMSKATVGQAVTWLRKANNK